MFLGFSFTLTDDARAYRSYYTQARTYGSILDGAGFDTSDLFYTITVAPRERRGDERLFRRVIDAAR